MKNENIYQQNGYKDRQDYFNNLIGDYGLDAFGVEYLYTCAEMMGPSEDFDGLLYALDDLIYALDDFII